MTKAEESELLRRLAGERTAAGWPERRAAAGDEDRSPGLRAAGRDEHAMPRSAEAAARGERPGAPADDLSRLAVLWAALEPPPPEPAPPGFAGRVMARVREEAPRGVTLAHRFGVLPARLAAASALAAGLVAGAGLGTLIAPPAGPGAGRGAGQVASVPAADARLGAAPPEGTGPAVAPPAAGEEAPAAAVALQLDDDELVAAAVAAAGEGEAAGEPGGGLDAAFGAEPGLAGDYLAALAALEEPS